jgi:CheY-like chemotaxis protein
VSEGLHAPRREGASRGRSATVLVVEDDEDARESLVEWLELEGFRVASANDGQQALDWLEAHGDEECVVLLDLVMPVMDGWQVLGRLQSRGWPPTLRVIITTSAVHRAPPGLMVHPKPVDLESLVRAVRGE